MWHQNMLYHYFYNTKDNFENVFDDTLKTNVLIAQPSHVLANTQPPPTWQVWKNLQSPTRVGKGVKNHVVYLQLEETPSTPPNSSSLYTRNITNDLKP